MKRFVFHLIIALLVVSPPAHAISTTNQLGTQERMIQERKSASSVVFKIDDELFITQADIDAYKQTEQFNNAKNRELLAKDNGIDAQAKQYVIEETEGSTDSEIRDKLIGDLVVLAEAKAKGIQFTEAQAIEFLDSNMKMVNDVLLNGTPEEREAAQQVLDYFHEFVRGFGMTESEYREKIQIPETIRLLTISEMKSRLLNTVDKEGKMTTDEFNKEYENYVNNLRKKYPTTE